MTTIYNTTTQEAAELSCIIDGIDILGSVMEDLEKPQVQPWIEKGDERSAFALSSEDFAWWKRWAEREERIAQAFDRADEKTRDECEQVVDAGEWEDYAHLQDEQERILGIDKAEGGVPSLSSEADAAREASAVLSQDARNARFGPSKDISTK